MRIDQFISGEAVDQLGDVVLLFGLDGSILDANPAALKCYGHSHAEITALSIHDIRAPQAAHGIADAQLAEAEEHAVTFETVGRRGDGTLFPVEVRSASVRSDGQTALLSIVRDITERRQAERELRESESRYRALAEGSPLAVFVSRNEKNDDEVVVANPACLRLFGASSPEDLLGRSALSLFDLDSQPLVRELICETSGPEPFIEVQIVRLDGTVVDVEAVASPLQDQGLGAIQVVLRDATARHHSEDEAHLSDEKFALAFNVAPDLQSITRVRDGMILEVNDGYERVLGFARAESVGKSTAQLSIWADTADRVRLLATVHEHGEITDFETTLRRKDGTLVEVTVSARQFELHGEACMLSVAHDITERRRSEESLEFNNVILSTQQEASTNGILVVDAAARILSYNRRFVELFGIPDSLVEDGVDEPVLEFVAKQAADQPRFLERIRYLYAHRREIGQDEVVLADGRVLSRYSAPMFGPREHYYGRAWFLQDITDRKRAEEYLAEQNARIERALTSVIEIASHIVEAGDPYTAGHQRRVAQLAQRIAHDIGMSDQEADDVRVAGLLHDVGKVTVPTQFLTKPGKLTATEFSIIRGHAEAGHTIITSAHMAEPIPELVYQHHERCDGSGYPRGLLGDQMLKGARVLAVADTVEAMMSHRPYRAALGIDAALAEIERGAGSLYDSEVSAACIALFRESDFALSEQPEANVPSLRACSPRP